MTVFLLCALAFAAFASNSPEPTKSIWSRMRHTIFGRPIHSKHAHHEKLGVLIGLPVFSSDALSSVAYATEAILSILIFIGINGLGMTWPITIAICCLIIVVGFSYRQTIIAYPAGGGTYIVASENLGQRIGLIGGAALLIDYILTVSVSVAAGVVAITSLYPVLHPHLTQISLLCVLVVMWANLRGVRESGAAFAIPTYTFVGLTLLMIVVALTKIQGGVVPVVQAEPGVLGSESHLPILFVVLRAFAAGCTALTGIEAVSDGVPAFRDPPAKHATQTLGLMVVLLTLLFVGTGYIAIHLPHLSLFATKNPNYTTVMSQIAAFTFGEHSFMRTAIQFSTAAILVLAANTAFADFPRLASFMARDGFLPRSLQRQGDRLVFQNGIIMLAFFAGLLIWIFHGELDLLLPLYAVGVFTAFTLSQSGMVRHWFKLKDKGWAIKAAINGFGAVVTGIVALIILVTKFAEGAWIVLVLVAALVLLLSMIHKRYDQMAKQLVLDPGNATLPKNHTVIVLVPRLHRGTMKAVEYGQKLAGEVRALHISFDQKSSHQLAEEWARFGIDMPLVMLNSPYRSLIEPVLDYVDQMVLEDPNRLVTVVVAEAVSVRLIHRLLQESVALQLKLALGSRKNIIVSSVRYFLS